MSVIEVGVFRMAWGGVEMGKRNDCTYSKKF